MYVLHSLKVNQEVSLHSIMIGYNSNQRQHGCVISHLLSSDIGRALGSTSDSVIYSRHILCLCGVCI